MINFFPLFFSLSKVEKNQNCIYTKHLIFVKVKFGDEAIDVCSGNWGMLSHQA